MPYIIRPPMPRLAAGLLAAMLLGVAPAQAETSSPDTSACSQPELTQPFLSAGDSNYYMLAPGQSPDVFGGAGWTLSGGATIAQTTAASGSSTSVLDLPSGSKAVSPTFCVTNEYPTARMLVRNVAGSEGVYFYVSYQGTKTWNAPKNTGQAHGSGTAWTVSSPLNMQPEKSSGWQLVRITLSAGGKTSEFQLYDLYIDPYSR
jgi:hypothetical protein